MKSVSKAYTYIWPAIAAIIVLLGSIYSKAGLLSSVMSVTGVIYVILIAKEHRLGYVFGIVNVILYIIILWSKKLYGTSIFNIIYSIPILIYGLICWNSKKNRLKISRLPNKYRIYIIFTTLIAILIYCLIVQKYTENVLVDGINVCVNIIASYLMAKKYVEQWYAWLIINFTNVVFWIYMTIQHIENLPMILMSVIYVINTFYGMFSWNKKLKQRIGENA